MATQLKIEDHIILLDVDITYNFQIGDIADFSKLKSNYTSSFQIPRTIEYVRMFEGLGLTGDTSTYPYQIRNVQCMDGYGVIYEGTLVVLNTDMLYYNCTVISGVHDLASLLGDSTLADLGLELIPKTVNDVSFNSTFGSTNLPDTFMFLTPFTADRVDVEDNIPYRVNVDVSAQAFKLNYLLDETFNSVGFTYSLPSTIDLENETLVVPSPPMLEIAANGYLGVKAMHTGTYVAVIVAGNPVVGWETWDYKIVNIPPFFDLGNTFECETSGNYILSFDYFFARMKRTSDPLNEGWVNCPINILVNNINIGTFTANNWGGDTSGEVYRTIRFLNVGDVVRVTISKPTELGIATDLNFERGLSSFNIYELEINEAKERNYLSFKLVELIREICFRYFLTPIQNGTHIDFISIYDIINNWDAIDWTDKYSQRTNESYDFGYSQNNWLRHSYVEETDDEFDLNVTSNNQNISLTRDIIESKIFAPVTNSIGLLDYQMFDVEEDNNGNIKYKTNSRYFFAKAEPRQRTSDTIFMSRTLPGEINPLTAYYVFTQYTAGFIDSDRWLALGRILQDTRVHQIELDLTAVDISQLVFDRLYFFRQEQAYYLLNTLRYTKGEKAIGEFVRVMCEQ